MKRAREVGKRDLPHWRARGWPAFPGGRRGRAGGPRPDLLRRRQADDRLRLRDRQRAATCASRTARSSRSAPTTLGDGDFALARYNPDGSLDTSFSGDGKQTTDFGGATGERRWRSRATARSSRSARTRAGMTSRSPATTPTARSTRASPATASRRPTSAGTRRGERGGDPGRRQDRRGRRRRRRRQRRLRARPLQRRRLARHELLRRRQADDRLRGRRRGERGGDPGGRQDRRGGGAAAPAPRLRARPLQPERLARHELLRRRQADDRLRRRRRRRRVALQGDGKIVAVGFTGGGTAQRLRARPLQPQRLARHELLRRRQADDRLRRRLDRAQRGGDPGNGKIVAVGQLAGSATSRSPATTPTARSTRASPATASRRPTSAGSDEANGVALQADGKIVAVGGAATTTSRSPATTRRLARHELLRRRQADDRLRGLRRASGVALQADGKIVAVGSALAATTSRSPATTRRLARHELLRRRQADDRLRGSTGRPGWRSRATARSSRSGTGGSAATSRSPATTPTARSTRASPATASRRPTSAGADAGERGGDPGGRQDRRGRRRSGAARRLRARPLQPERLARHELLRRRQADDRLRRLGAAKGWRSRPTARSSRSAQCTARHGDFALARYNPNGSLDTSFSGDGKQTTDFGGSTRANGVAIQADGKIVAVGRRHRRRRLRARPLQPERIARHELLRGRQADDRLRGLRRGERRGAPGRRQDRRGRRRGAGGNDFALARYNPNGSLDTSFSGDGKRTTDFGGSTARTEWRSRATARSSSRWAADGRRNCDFALARYNPNGSLDTSFSGDGQGSRLRVLEPTTDPDRGSDPTERKIVASSRAESSQAGGRRFEPATAHRPVHVVIRRLDRQGAGGRFATSKVGEERA